MRADTGDEGTEPHGRRLHTAPHYDPPVVESRFRTIRGVVGRVVLALIMTLVLAGAALVILGYTGLEFGILEVAVAVVIAGAVVFAWTRWR